jgi:hypothetical protein
MPQIIYSGKDYQKPVQSQGRALQALGQFTQQQEMRKQADLERSRKDRDTFARLMEMDPVYATSAKIQQEMAVEMDSYIDAMTEVNKGMQGRAMNTQDIMRMQQEKARVMGRLGQLKSWDSEINKAANLVKTRPDLYDTRMFNEAFQEFRETGVFPEEGMLFPLVKDPFEEYNKYAYEHRRTTGVEDVPGEIVQNPETL